MSRSCFSKGISFCILVLITCSFPASLSGQGRPDVLWMRSGYDQAMLSIDYSPDGQMFASNGDSCGLVKIWRVSDGMLLRTIKATPPATDILNCFPANMVKFTPDSQNIVIEVIENGVVFMKLVRLSDGVTLRTFGNEQHGVTTLKFVPDGSLAVATGTLIKLFDISTGSLLRTITTITYLAGNGTVQNFGFYGGTAFFSDNGRILVSRNDGGNLVGVAVINLEGRLVGFLNLNSSATPFGITRDGNFVIVADPVKKVYRADLCPDLTCSPDVIAPLPNANLFRFSPDGQTLASIASQNGPLELYRVSDWSLIRTFPVRHTSATGC